MKRRDDLQIGAKEKMVEAIKAGKSDSALKQLNEMLDQFRISHDRYVDMINLLMGKLAEVKGDKWFENFERTRCHGNKERFEAWKNLSADELIKIWCDIQRPHFSEWLVEEDDEKYVLNITDCNMGGRLLKEGIASRQDAITKKGYPWSANQKGFPYYCAHYYFYNELFDELGLKIEAQYARQYDDQGNRTGASCKYIIYK